MRGPSLFASSSSSNLDESPEEAVNVFGDRGRSTRRENIVLPPVGRLTGPLATRPASAEVRQEAESTSKHSPQDPQTDPNSPAESPQEDRIVSAPRSYVAAAPPVPIPASVAAPAAPTSVGFIPTPAIPTSYGLSSKEMEKRNEKLVADFSQECKTLLETTRKRLLDQVDQTLMATETLMNISVAQFQDECLRSSAYEKENETCLKKLKKAGIMS